MIRVRFAESGDVDGIVEFIREHWSATHLFVDRPDVLQWQHQQPDAGLNMVLAEDVGDDGATVLGVLGFIPTGRFDPSLGTQDMTLAIWRVKDGGPPGLGLRLLKHIDREIAPRLIGAIGISEMVKPIYKLLKYDQGTMTHSAVINPLVEQTAIAAGVPADLLGRPLDEPDPTVAFEPITMDVAQDAADAIDTIGAAEVPAKSYAYLRERFLDHPWYRYELRLVRDAGQPVAVIVWRSVEAEGSRILRIVDIVGDTAWLSKARGHLQHLTVEADAEYIDLVQTGTGDDVLDAAGFVTVGRTPDLVLPNYFAPFERRNVPVDFAYKCADGAGPLRLYRADSDQDRPNQVSELL